MKRNGPDHRKSKLVRPNASGYTGYVIDSAQKVECTDKVDDFYHRFVEIRKPVKITGCGAHPAQIAKFRMNAIEETLGYSGRLQIERKHRYGFGLGTTRQLMPLSTIVEKLRLGDDTYYLTTQYDEHDVEDADDAQKEDGEDDAELSPDGEDILVGVPAGGAADDADDSADSFDEADLHDDFDDDDDESVDWENGKDDFEHDDAPESDNDDEYAIPSLKLTEEDIEYRVRTLLQPPLTNLVYKEDFPINPKPFENLVTQQINLWMGASREPVEKPDLLHPTRENLGKYVPSGNSSGLHHDHADNLYVLVEGRKRFTLYSPADALQMYTVGHIHKVYPNGLIDYKVDSHARHWRHMRDDGAIVAEHARWLLNQEDFSVHSKENLEAIIENEEEYNGSVDEKLDPPSFSTVPPILAHLDELTDQSEIEALTKFANAEFPGFLSLNKMEVWLEPGDMLYLPCGWFHEVTSFSDSTSNVHIALNWWFMPPVTSSELNPYPDDYWRQDFAQTRAGVEFLRNRTLQQED